MTFLRQQIYYYKLLLTCSPLKLSFMPINGKQNQVRASMKDKTDRHLYVHTLFYHQCELQHLTQTGNWLIYALHIKTDELP
jgi:hypothetical protein